MSVKAFSNVMLLALAGSALTSARAQSASDGPYVGVAQAVTHLNNVFNAADGPNRVSDTYLSTSLLAGAALNLGRQRLSLDARVGNNRYNKLSLENTSHNLNLGLDWATAERLSGRINHTSSKAQAAYGADSTLVLNGQNIQRLEQTDAVARVGVTTPLTLEVSAQQQRIDFSAPEYARLQRTQRRGSVGARYQFSSQLGVGLALRRTDGRYPQFTQTTAGNYLADRYRRNDIDFSANWVPTGLSTVTVRVSYGKQENSGARNLSASGATGAIAWDYRPTGRLSFNTSLSHDTSAESSLSEFDPAQGAGLLSAAGSRSTRLALSAIYEATTKIKLSSTVSVVHRQLSTSAQGGVAREGSDTTRRFSLGARYQALRNLSVDCSLASESRSSTTPLSYDYSAASIGCSLLANLQ